jgi:hypothetical protein
MTRRMSIRTKPGLPGASSALIVLVSGGVAVAAAGGGRTATDAVSLSGCVSSESIEATLTSGCSRSGAVERT